MGAVTPAPHTTATGRGGAGAPPGAGLHASPVPSPGSLAAGVPVQANNGLEQKKPSQANEAAMTRSG